MTHPATGAGLLDEIVVRKKRDLPSILSAPRPEGEPTPRRDFRAALVRHDLAEAPRIVAEMKKASPSAGVIVVDYVPLRIAQEYKVGGASALSVLTDTPFFSGDPMHLQEAKQAADLPALCKDFLIDPRQAAWASAHGADAILLIMRILEDIQYAEMLSAAQECGLAILTETHSASEIVRAIGLGADIIGINSRDLDTLEVSLSVAEALISQIPPGVIAVAESGIATRLDVERLTKCGFGAFLIGESLLRADDRAGALRRLRGV